MGRPISRWDHIDWFPFILIGMVAVVAFVAIVASISDDRKIDRNEKACEGANGDWVELDDDYICFAKGVVIPVKDGKATVKKETGLPY